MHRNSPLPVYTTGLVYRCFVGGNKRNRALVEKSTQCSRCSPNTLGNEVLCLRREDENETKKFSL